MKICFINWIDNIFRIYSGQNQSTYFWHRHYSNILKCSVEDSFCGSSKTEVITHYENFKHQKNKSVPNNRNKIHRSPIFSLNTRLLSVNNLICLDMICSSTTLFKETDHWKAEESPMCNPHFFSFIFSNRAWPSLPISFIPRWRNDYCVW